MCAEKFDYIFQFGKAAKEEKTMQVSEVASFISHTLYYRTFLFCLFCHIVQCGKDCKVLNNYFSWTFFIQTVQWYQNEAIGLRLMKSEKLSLRQIGCEIGQFPRWLNFACYNAAQMLKRHFLSQLREPYKNVLADFAR